MKGGTEKKKNGKKVILRQVSQSAVIPPWIYSLSESGLNVIKDSQLTAVKHRKGVNFQPLQHERGSCLEFSLQKKHFDGNTCA